MELPAIGEFSHFILRTPVLFTFTLGMNYGIFFKISRQTSKWSLCVCVHSREACGCAPGFMAPTESSGGGSCWTESSLLLLLFLS